MAEERVQRRLAAILAADVVGYSRLMGTDEAGTLAALKARRKDVLEPLVAKHQGRVFKITGDGVMVEFASAVNAVQCAVELQRNMAATNNGQREDSHIVLRIGVNLGDVMVEGSDLYGDSVNIAARLEAIAQPGGILISGTAFDYVRNKVNAGFEDLGSRTLKNIAESVRVYRITGTPAVAVAALTPISDKPSIAVLPFTNLSGDPEQQYFSDEITEDIITELSRFRSLFVIARNSCFQFRGPSIDHTEVRRKLGIRYLVEGSVRKLGDGIRIAAQLIDAERGSHLWAERYDRDWRDIFTVQDELVRTIVATIEGRVVPSVAAQARRKPTNDLSAYDLVLQGRDLWNRYDAHGAQALLRQAIGLDPAYAAAHAWLGLSLLVNWIVTGDERTITDALTHGETSVALDADDSQCHATLAQVLLFFRRYEEALFHYERALQLNPNDCAAHAMYAAYLLYDGQADAALERLAVVLQRDPYPALWYWDFQGHSLYQLHRYDEAAAAFLKMGRSQTWAYAMLAASLAMAGRMEDSRRQMRTYLTVEPDGARLSSWGRTDPFRYKADLEHLLDGLRKAGLPE